MKQMTGKKLIPPDLMVREFPRVADTASGSDQDGEMMKSQQSVEFVRAVAVAIAQPVVDQEGSGATFNVGSMTVIDQDGESGMGRPARR